MALRGVLLDFNGVVINDEAIHRQLLDELLLRENLRPLTPEEYYRFCLGRSDRAGLTDLFEYRGRGLTPAYLQGLITWKAQRYRETLIALDSLPLYDGLIPFLDQLQFQRLAIALVTGALRSEVDYILDRSGLTSYFSVVVAGDDLQASKPDPDGYLQAIAQLNQHQLTASAAEDPDHPSLIQESTHPLQPQECLAIEDTLAGIQAAKGAGVWVVGIAHTYPYHFMQRQAHWAVDRFEELDLDRLKVVLARHPGETEIPVEPSYQN